MIINQFWMLLNIVILHMNHKHKLNPTSCHWAFFLLEPMLKYIHIRFFQWFVFISLCLALVNISLAYVLGLFYNFNLYVSLKFNLNLV